MPAHTILLPKEKDFVSGGKHVVAAPAQDGVDQSSRHRQLFVVSWLPTQFTDFLTDKTVLRVCFYFPKNVFVRFVFSLMQRLNVRPQITTVAFLDNPLPPLRKQWSLLLRSYGDVADASRP